jgi:hypothetical protein
LKKTTRQLGKRTSESPPHRVVENKNNGRPLFWNQLKEMPNVQLADYMRTQLASIVTYQRNILQHANKIGAALVIIKERLQHGEFQPWMKANCDLSPTTWRLYMRVALNWQTIEPLIGGKINSLEDADEFLAKQSGRPPLHDLPDDADPSEDTDDTSDHPSPDSQVRLVYTKPERTEYDTLIGFLIENGHAETASDAVLQSLRAQCQGLGYDA